MRFVPEFPDYEITEDGRVWSKPRITHHGHNWKGRWLKPWTKRDGHLQVALRKNGKTFHPLVHRLVLETFVGPCPEGMEACHNNGNPSDNRLENLRWDTRQANVKDRDSHGNTFRGERVGTSKLTEAEVKEIRELCQTSNYTQTQIGETYGVSHNQISRIVNNKQWQHF